MENKYRIVEDAFSGYEAQIKYWWLPFLWIEMSEPGYFSNTWSSLDRAKEFIISSTHKEKKCKKRRKIYWESIKD